MNEINTNSVGGSMGIPRPSDAVSGQRSTPVKRQSSLTDSAEFSQLPDFSVIDKAIEDDFAELTSRLRYDAESESYPALETIDKVAAMLAVEIQTDRSSH